MYRWPVLPPAFLSIRTVDRSTTGAAGVELIDAPRLLRCTSISETRRKR
jgi:hypothetical protein